MKDKDLKNLFLNETSKIDINMSEKLKNTPIQSSKQQIQEATVKKKFNWRNWFLPITATACLIIMLFSFVIPWNSTGGNSYLTAYILEINQSLALSEEENDDSSEINPSFAFVTDEDDNIINICSVNEDADEILNNEEFNDISNMKLSEAIEKVIKITSNEGIFDEYTDKIKIYALNDNKNKIDKKLNRFGEFIKQDLKEFGYEEIDFEKRSMEIDFFREKMGFDKMFDKLDDMRDDIKMHDRFKGEFPPPPPPPNGENFPPEPTE